MAVAGILADAHGAALRLVSAHCQRPFIGLTQAARALPRLPKQLRRRLSHLDVASHIVRHLTEQTVASFLDELATALREDVAHVPEMFRAASVVGVASPARDGAGAPVAGDVVCPVAQLSRASDRAQSHAGPTAYFTLDFGDVAERDAASQTDISLLEVALLTPPEYEGIRKELPRKITGVQTEDGERGWKTPSFDVGVQTVPFVRPRRGRVNGRAVQAHPATVEVGVQVTGCESDAPCGGEQAGCPSGEACAPCGGELAGCPHVDAPTDCSAGCPAATLDIGPAHALAFDVASLRSAGQRSEAQLLICKVFEQKFRAVKLRREYWRQDAGPDSRKLEWDDVSQKGFVRGPLYDVVCERFDHGDKDPRYKSDDFFALYEQVERVWRDASVRGQPANFGK